MSISILFHNSNSLLIYFTKIKDPFGQIGQLAKFLGKEVSSEELKTLIAYTSFDSMKQIPSLDVYQMFSAFEDTSSFFQKGSQFYVKGQVGNWYGHLSEELSDRFDKAVEANLKYAAKIEYGQKPKEIQDEKNLI